MRIKIFTFIFITLCLESKEGGDNYSTVRFSKTHTFFIRENILFNHFWKHFIKP